MNVPTRTILGRPGLATADPSSALAAEEIVRLLNAVRRAFRARYAGGASGGELADRAHYLPLLHQIAERPGVTVNELARLTWTHKSRVSVLVARLVELGIVGRAADEHDTRLVRLRITAEGQARAAAWRAASSQALLHSLASLSDEQLGSIVEGLDLLLRALEQNAPVERPPAC
jgi:DNA-binding MarR family transcriptional regulator